MKFRRFEDSNLLGITIFSSTLAEQGNARNLVPKALSQPGKLTSTISNLYNYDHSLTIEQIDQILSSITKKVYIIKVGITNVIGITNTMKIDKYTDYKNIMNSD